MFKTKNMDPKIQELKKKIDEPMTLEHFSMWLEKFKKEVGYYEWLEKQKAMN